MEENNRTMVEMTEEEKAQFETFRKKQQRKAEEESRKQQRTDLQKLTDDVMDEAVADLRQCNEMLKATKEKVMRTFDALMEMRRQVNKTAGKSSQESYTFTNSRGDLRMRIGYNMLDNYLDSVEEGIAKVKEYIASLAKDEDSKRMVSMVTKLLQRNEQGQLKASRVMQLWKIAQESGDAEFIEGMKIIQESYRPIQSKLYVRASVKATSPENEGAWEDITLSLTGV